MNPGAHVKFADNPMLIYFYKYIIENLVWTFIYFYTNSAAAEVTKSDMYPYRKGNK